jgi:hypothetical protein
MSTLSNLTLDELTEIVRTCEAIEIHECTPPYLKDFIASRLAAPFPDLSTKVRRFAQQQMELLCEHIRRTYALLR